jgi:hypothetical protein
LDGLDSVVDQVFSNKNCYYQDQVFSNNILLLYIMNGIITTTVANNLYDNLTLPELEDLATKLKIVIIHTVGEQLIFKYKLCLKIADKLLLAANLNHF